MSDRFVEIREAARDDLIAHYGWLTSEAGEDVAEAMLANAAAEFEKLARMTGLGSPVETQRRELAGLRKWRIPSFPKLRIFYLPTDDYLFVVRVLHTSQDRLAEIERG